jgi:hypothetical protein
VRVRIVEQAPLAATGLLGERPMHGVIRCYLANHVSNFISMCKLSARAQIGPDNTKYTGQSV